VIRARGRTAAETWVNVLRGHSASPQIRRRFRHHSSTVCPETGRSFSCITGRSFTAEHSARWTRALPRRLLDDHLHGRCIDPSNLKNAELVLKTEQH
jgi:hypothetical protein